MTQIKPPSFPWDDVPLELRHPPGPIHKAPDEFGGDGWRVTPFTGKEPWKQWAEKHGGLTPAAGVPDDFERLFGPRPTRATVPDYFAHRLAEMEWEQDLKNFIRAGVPPEITQDQIDAADAVFDDWGMGKAQFFQSKHGWRAIWPDQTAVPGYSWSPSAAVSAAHLVVAKWQIRILQKGGKVENPHPWVPPHLLTPGE